jgi:hypothetical protein
MNAVRSYERLEAEVASLEGQASFYRDELALALREAERLRTALRHVVNCFPDMPAVGLQTAQAALGDA